MHRLVIFRHCIKFFITFIALSNTIYGDLETIEGDDVNIHEFNQEIIFVSLGSYCAPASLARSCGYRKAAFPFDWNISLDGEKLIEILNEDFSNFLNKDYLAPFGAAALLNTYYHLEFVHDGSWDEVNFSSYMPILQAKYTRRIEKFKKLKEHQGKVIFMRAAYIYSIEDRHRCYKAEANVEISEDYALRLYKSLRNFFPTLDFSLIIINNHEQESVVVEKRVSDSLWMVRAAPAYEVPVMQNAYANFFNELVQSENQSHDGDL